MCHNVCDSRRLSEPLNRRKLLKSLLNVGAGALLTGLYAWRLEPHWLQFTFPTLPVKDLPPELEGKTLAQLSDLHVGPQVDDDYVVHSFRRLSKLSPDFVVCTGDWISYRVPRQFDQLRLVLAHLPKGRLGTVGILGNHDLRPGLAPGRCCGRSCRHRPRGRSHDAEE
jgi:predicted MPP superfamily phosphohydrolase